LLLLGNQSTPLRPCLLFAFIHAPSLPQSSVADKMWFRYRSQCHAEPGTRIIRNKDIVVGLKPDSETKTQIRIIFDNENLGVTRAFQPVVE
jgi:hypothetical protein